MIRDSVPNEASEGSSLSPTQRRELRCFGDRLNRLGANFAVCNGRGHIILLFDKAGFRSSRTRLVEISRQVLSDYRRLSHAGEMPTDVYRFSETNLILASVLAMSSDPRRSASDPIIALADLGDASAAVAGAFTAGSQQYKSQHHCLYITEMLGMLSASFERMVQTEHQMDQIGLELGKVYEELVLLHRLSANMKVTESDAHFLQMACDCLTEVVPVAGIAIVLEKMIGEEKQRLIAAGSGVIDLNERMIGLIYSRLLTDIQTGREALIDSKAFEGFRYDWPETLHNIIAVPLLGKDCHDSYFMRRGESSSHVIGFMVAVNAADDAEFDSTTAKLFNSVAGGCAVFIENGYLFSDLSDLFIGSLKALTDSIDAKDGYTHGHSERVALIARWIAEGLVAQGELRPDQVYEVYLAGLLHDIGKIGIRDHVLSKFGPLTEEERECMKKHPEIGAGILRGIKQMTDVVPGVLYHHEWVDGSGYPHGLKGAEIPLIGKIVGLADSFDAMTSRRSYRDSKRIEEAIEEIQACAGTQFDPFVVEIFLHTDIHQLWDMMQYGWKGVGHTLSREPYPHKMTGSPLT